MDDASPSPSPPPVPERKRTFVHLGHPDHHIPKFELPARASKPLSRMQCAMGFLVAVGGAFGGWGLKVAGAGSATPEVGVGWLAPFAVLLMCIAVLPFAAEYFWERRYPYVALGLGLAVGLYYCLGLGAAGRGAMAENLADYVSFVFLIGSLFVVSGGVAIHIRRSASPGMNVMLLLGGALLANVVGTTGAAMLLIRPFLRANRGRVKAYHIVFFIFLVANVGGAMTPIGDPPLFMGYLRGVPFGWVAQRCLWIWLTAVGCLVGVFYVLDLWHWKRSKTGATGGTATQEEVGARGEMVSIFGAANALFIGMILVAVFCESPAREIVMAAAAFGSLATTSHRIYGENLFNYAPIKEVAILFAGIFATMVPAMNYMHNHANDASFRESLRTPGQFYFASGGLSGVLDSAPTYVTFLETGLGKLGIHAAVIEREKQVIKGRNVQLTDALLAGFDAVQAKELRQVHGAMVRYHADAIARGEVDENAIEMAYMLDDSGLLNDGEHAYFKFLVALSMGAVFFGAATYIGNGPNFMVKSIAEHAGVKTPSFFAFIGWYTIPVLLPVLVLCWYLFLR